MSMTSISIPNDFDFEAAFDKAMKETLAPVGRLEMLKSKPSLTSKEVQELYGIPESSLRTWRSRGGGPVFSQPYEKGTALYEHAAIKDFLHRNKIRG